MAKKFLSVKQGEIFRWEYKDAEHSEYGLYTEGFYNCTIILLKNTNNGRISLLHADTTITQVDVQQEMQWVGEGCEKIIYYKDVAEDIQTIDDVFQQNTLKNRFNLIKINKQTRNGQIVIDRTMPAQADGTPTAEYEADAILLSKDKIETTKKFIAGYTFIKDKATITNLYIKLYKTRTDITPKWAGTSEQAIFAKLEAAGAIRNNTQSSAAANNESKLKETLQNQTTAYFKNPINTNWKKYPTSGLIGKYAGHQVLFFTMAANQQQNAINFTTHLHTHGFAAELKQAKDKPSVIVDLTTSRLSM